LEYVHNMDHKVDVAIMLNVHMWIWKQHGEEKVKEMMRELSEKVGVLYFQTAHKESGGMFILKHLKNARDIEGYLKECGFGNVKKINVTKGHRGKRIMYRCSKEAV